MFVPSPYGQAFVTSQTLDVYQQTLLQTNTVFGFVRVPNPQIPRDLNIVSFRISSQYLRPGRARWHDRLRVQPGDAAHRRADVRDVDRPDVAAVRQQLLARARSGTTPATCGSSRPTSSSAQIDQQAFNALALYQSHYATQGDDPWPNDSR